MVLSVTGCKKDNKDTAKENETQETTTSNTGTSSQGLVSSYEYLKKLGNITDEYGDNVVNYKYQDFITLGEYKGIKAEVDSSTLTISDEAVQSSIDSYLTNYGTENQIVEGTTKEGDSINLDYEGKIDGVPFENGAATGASYEVGSGMFIEDLDKGLVGLEVGKEYSIPVTFPSDYGTEALNGKDAVFTVKVNYIAETVLPELTDEIVAKIATDYSLSVANVSEFKAYVKKSLEDNAKQKFDDAKFSGAWDKIIEGCEFKGTPEIDYNMVMNTLDNQLAQYVSQYQSLGLDRASILQYFFGVSSEEEYETYKKEEADSYCKTKLAAMAIAEKEGITVTKEEIDEVINQYVEYYQYGSVEELKNSISSGYGSFVEEACYQVVSNKVYELILKETVEVETSTKAE